MKLYFIRYRNDVARETVPRRLCALEFEAQYPIYYFYMFKVNGKNNVDLGKYKVV